MKPYRLGIAASLLASIALTLATLAVPPRAVAADSPVPAAPAKKKAARRGAPPAALATPIPTPAVPVSPYLQNPATDAVSILWRTALPAYGWIEYGETPALGQKQDRVIDGMREANTIDHHIRLSGLTPGKTYYYRAASKIITKYGGYQVAFAETQYSSTTQFALPDPAAQRVSCCFLNDLHNNLPLFNTFAAQIRRAAPDAVFFNGDCLADPNSQNAVLKELQVYTTGVEAARRLTFFIRGNHEIRGGYARDLKSRLEYPEGEFYFAYTLGPVRFIALDCGEDKTDDHIEYSGLNDFSGFRKAQAAWLKKELGSVEFKQARWHILLVHIPLYGFGASDLSMKEWGPVLRGAPIDLEISAHTHHQKIIQKGEAGNPWPLVIGGGSSPRQGATMTLLQAGEAGLEVKQYGADGKEVGTLKIKR